MKLFLIKIKKYLGKYLRRGRDRKFEAFTVLEILVSIGVFSVISLGLLLLFRDEVKEFALVRGEVSRSVSIKRIENLFADFLEPVVGGEKRALKDLWSEDLSRAEVQILEGGRALTVGERSMFLKEGSIVEKKRFREEVLLPRTEKGIRIKNLLFSKSGSILSVDLALEDDENLSRKKLRYLLR